MSKRLKIIMLMLMTIIFSISTQSAEIDDYRISTTDNLNLREGPSINSKIVIVNSAEGKEKMQLRITWTVKILKISEKEEIIKGNNGRWVFVDTGFLKNSDEKITGWIFDYYLAKKSDFEPLTSLPYNMVLDWEDDVAENHYQFYKDGTFIYNSKNKGKLYIDKRKKILLRKFDNEKDLLPFDVIEKFYLKDGNICIVGGGEVDSIKHTVADACSRATP